jgi:hypothetical protein
LSHWPLCCSSSKVCCGRVATGRPASGCACPPSSGAASHPPAHSSIQLKSAPILLQPMCQCVVPVGGGGPAAHKQLRACIDGSLGVGHMHGSCVCLVSCSKCGKQECSTASVSRLRVSRTFLSARVDNSADDTQQRSVAAVNGSLTTRKAAWDTLGRLRTSAPVCKGRCLAAAVPNRPMKRKADLGSYRSTGERLVAADAWQISPNPAKPLANPIQQRVGVFRRTTDK